MMEVKVEPSLEGSILLSSGNELDYVPLKRGSDGSKSQFSVCSLSFLPRSSNISPVSLEAFTTFPVCKKVNR